MRLGAVGGTIGTEESLLYLDRSGSEEDNLLIHVDGQENINAMVEHRSNDFDNSSRIASTDPLPMLKQNASDAIGDTEIGTFKNGQCEQLQEQDVLVGDTIEVMTSSPALPIALPPLYATTPSGISGGRKQSNERQYRRSGCKETKNSNQEKNDAPQIEEEDVHQHPDDTNLSIEMNSNANRSSLKSTIDNNGDEWSTQQKEIGLFSHFATGTRDNDGATRQARRTKQRSYGQLRTRHLHQESGEDSSSQASSDQSYVNFFHPNSPSQQPTSQPSLDVSYQRASPSPRMLSHGQGRSSPPPPINTNLSPRGTRTSRNISSKSTNSINHIQRSDSNTDSALGLYSSYDGAHPTAGHINQNLHIKVDPITISSGSPMYQTSPTYYYPSRGHHRGSSETPVSNQRFDFEQQQHLYHQISHNRSHSFAAPLHESPSSLSNHYLYPQQQYSTVMSRSETPSNRNRDPSLSYDSSNRSKNLELNLQQQQVEQQGRDTYTFDDDDSYSNSISSHSSKELEKERGIHVLRDGLSHDKRVPRQHRYDNSIPKFDRRQFLPQTFGFHDDTGQSNYPTFVCPNCKMRQREFFTVSSAPKQHGGEGIAISLMFAVYVVASLYIFGLQEGWGKLDCIYFAVITLTTAGLGDLVPTTDGSKIICSIFIYFGVACIGLLLGSYIAGMLDEKSYREAVANQIKACPNCANIKNMRYISEEGRVAYATLNDKMSMERIAERHAISLRSKNPKVKASKKVRRHDDSPQFSQSETPSSSKFMRRESEDLSTKTPLSFESPTMKKQLLGSPMTTQILRRQSHTRHVSMDLQRNEIGLNGGNAHMLSRFDFDLNTERYRNNSADIHIPATVNEGTQSMYEKNTPAKEETKKKYQENVESSEPSFPHLVSETSKDNPQDLDSDDSTVEDSDSDTDSLGSEVDVIEGRHNGIRNAKYVILTLREALVNSLVIIAFGCFGFYLIEGFSFVDSLYFTTVLLTSTGYGDIVPKSEGGKLFATVYLLVGGTILLNNMSMISMIPLELRKRRTEHSVLTQFGDSLDDDALRELATGPLIQRINLGGKNTRGLDECTREMFALAMMIRLGKVTEHDIKLTFAAFSKLDVHNEGILNSKSIIGGMIQKRRRMNLNNRNKNEGSDQNTGFVSGGNVGWIDPPVPHHFDGIRGRSSSTNGSFVPNSYRHSMNHTDQAPLLSMSERGFPQYGMNRHPFAPTQNE